VPKNSKIIALFCFLGIVSAMAQDIKIDSIVAPAMLYNNRSESFTFKHLREEIEIKPTQNFFYIHYHSSKPNTVYEYQMQGLESYFVETHNTYAYYSNIPEGIYIFMVKEKGKSETTALKFIVEGPFWQKWWFSPVVFLFVLGMAAIVFSFFFLYRSRQQLHLQSVRYELEIKALRAQMNPHFIFNCLNTIDAYILRKRFVEASDCLQKFSKLIRQILENSEYQTISIEKELTALKLYIELEQERFGNTFEYHIEADPALAEDQYQIPPLLLQPFVENAILHGIRHLKDRSGLLSIVLTKTFVNEKESLFCEIIDNGIGRTASAQLHEQHKDRHKSMGMNVTFERIIAHQVHYGEQMKTQIEDLNGVNTGTKVQIWLPLLTS